MTRNQLRWLILGIGLSVAGVFVAVMFVMLFGRFDFGGTTVHAQEENGESRSPSDELIDGPASWRAAAEKYRNRPTPPLSESSARYEWVSLFGDLYAQVYRDRNFEEVEKALRAKYANIADAHELHDYHRIMTNFGTLRYDYEPEDLLIAAEEWTEERPDSHFAWLVRGALASGHAWYWRGTGYAHTITEDGGRNFVKYMQEAFDYLQRAYEIEPEDPVITVFLLQAAIDSGAGRDTCDRYFERAISIAPAHYNAYQTNLRRLLPKWGGSWDEVEAYVRYCDERADTVGNPMLRWIRYNAYREMEDDREGYKDVFKQQEIIDGESSVYEDVYAKWPESLEAKLNYCRMLYRQKRYLDSYTLFEEIGFKYYSHSRWDSRHQYNYCRAFATSKYAQSLTDRDQRIRAFEKAIELSPDGDYYFRLAYEYRSVSDFETAEKLYLLGIENEPKWRHNWLGLGGLYRELERWKDLEMLVAASREIDLNEKSRAALDEMGALARQNLEK